MGDDTEEMEVDVPEQVGESHPVQKRFFKAKVRYMKEYCRPVARGCIEGFGFEDAKSHTYFCFLINSSTILKNKR